MTKVEMLWQRSLHKMSITINNSQNLHALFATKKTNLSSQKYLPDNPVDSVSKTSSQKTSSLRDIKYSGNISNVKPEEVKALYEQIKQSAKTTLEAANLTDKKLEPYDYHNATIDSINNAKIDAEIDADEVHTAILYNRMGINFLDIKEIETRMEIFKLAENDVKETAKNSLIRKDQEQELLSKIETNLTKLADKKQNILDGNKKDVSAELFLEQVKTQRNMNL